MKLLDLPLNNILFAAVLVLARFTSFFAASPLFSRRAMSRIVRLGIAGALTLVCIPPVAAGLAGRELAASVVLVLVFKELSLGFLLGLVLWLPVRGLELAGVILDTQRGSTQAQDLDVVFNAQTTPTAILLSQVFSGYFFASGGYLTVVTLLYEGIRIWPPSDYMPHFAAGTIELFVRLAGGLFYSGLVLVLPIAGLMLIADIAIAFLARSAQSLNALTFGMPVKSAIMLIILIPYLGIMYPRLIEAFSEGFVTMSKVFAP